MKEQIEEFSEADLTENTIEFDLRTMKIAERKASTKVEDAASNSSDDSDDSTMDLFESTITMSVFENTVTNLNVADLELPKKAVKKTRAKSADSEPAWRVLEKRREERELQAIMDDYLF